MLGGSMTKEDMLDKIKDELVYKSIDEISLLSIQKIADILCIELEEEV